MCDISFAAKGCGEVNIYLGFCTAHRTVPHEVQHHVPHTVLQVCGISIVYCCLGPGPVTPTPPNNWLSTWGSQFNATGGNGSSSMAVATATGGSPPSPAVVPGTPPGGVTLEALQMRAPRAEPSSPVAVIAGSGVSWTRDT